MKPWRVWAALLAMPLLLGATFLLVVIYLTRRGVPPESLRQAIEPLAWLPASFAFTAGLLLTLSLARRDAVPLGWTRPSPADLAVGLGAGVAVAALDALLLHPLMKIDLSLPSVSLPVAAISLALAAVAEDSLYRGYALETLRKRHGLVPGVAITTLFYALLTPGAQWPLMLWAAGFGVLLCALRLRRGNLWPAVTAHLVVALAPKLLAKA